METLIRDTLSNNSRKISSGVCHTGAQADSYLNDPINMWDAFICECGTLACLSTSIQHVYVKSKNTHTHFFPKLLRRERGQKETWPDESDKSLRIWNAGKRRVGDEKLQRLLQSTPIKHCGCLVLLLLLRLFPARRSSSLRVGSLGLHLREPPWQARFQTLLIHISP